MRVASTIALNAARLLRDAKTLLSNQSYDTAASLAILSMEESSKACLVLWRRSGLIQCDILKDIREGHIQKQRLFGIYRFIRAGIDAVVRDDSGELIDKNDVTDELVDIAAKAGLEAGHKEMVFADIGLFDHLKQFGFYVDVDENLEIAPTLGRASKADAEWHIRDAEDALKMFYSEPRFHSAMAAVYVLRQSAVPAKQRKAAITAALRRVNREDS